MLAIITGRWPDQVGDVRTPLLEKGKALSENPSPNAQDRDIVSAVSTVELSRRPSRKPNYAAESKALVGLARTMANFPDLILQGLSDTALTLCDAHSAGLSLLEDEDDRRNFHWRAISGDWACHLNGGTPREFGPCGTVLDRNVPLVFSHPERDFPYFGEVRPPLEDALLLPFYIDGEARGTIWVVFHDPERKFDAEDLRILTNLGNFASLAYQTVLSLKAARSAARLQARSDETMQRFTAIIASSDDAIIS
jgi:GAF domain-containing protein